MIWEVFRQEEAGKYHTHCGNVHAPDRDMALMFAQIQHGRRKPTNSLWVVPKDEIGEVDADETAFGGTTDKSYRWVMAYNRHRLQFRTGNRGLRERTGGRGPTTE